MLYIYFGQFGVDDVWDSRYMYNIDDMFDHFYEESWCTDFAKKILKDIDNTEFLYPSVINSPVFGIKDVSWISGTAKCLIMMQAVQDVLHNGDNLGDEAWPYLIRLSKDIDICINQTYAPLFDWPENIPVTVLNDGRIIKSDMDFVEAVVLFNENTCKVTRLDSVKWPYEFNRDRLRDEWDSSFDNL